MIFAAGAFCCDFPWGFCYGLLGLGCNLIEPNTVAVMVLVWVLVLVLVLVRIIVLILVLVLVLAQWLGLALVLVLVLLLVLGSPGSIGSTSTTSSFRSSYN